MSALMCSRPGCATHAMPKPVNGVWTDPPGWSNVTITGQPIVNRLLCPSCSSEVRELLGTPAHEIQAARDAEIEGAFKRGFDAGLAEPIQLRAVDQDAEVSA